LTARTLMIQGTASSVGKSLIVTGLCRVLRQEGFRVAPFKAQNMALNASVTPDGGEIGRAQAVQADAAGALPSVDMNPVLLKPEGDARSQVVVLGQSIGSMSAREYHEKKHDLKRVIADSLARLRRDHDVVVIEGAGSPAEINLRDRDIVNMHVARLADAPVLLVGDIDRGGVFASLVGTMELLEADERVRVAGLVINKFRGDVTLLKPGLEFIERRTGVPVIGVVPHVPRLRIADEDSVSLESRRMRGPARANEIEIAVVHLPRIANYDDFEPLENEPGVVVRFVDRPRDVAGADLAIVPGTKSTLSDLGWLREGGLDRAILERARRGLPVLGVCGGCQMLGEWIDDPDGVESVGPARSAGLGLLPVTTRFERKKTTARVAARSLGRGFFGRTLGAGVLLEGYEIHMGRLEATRDDLALFEINEKSGRPARAFDGGVDESGAVVGTMIHGLFENDSLRNALLHELRRRKGIAATTPTFVLPTRQSEYDRLAGVLRESLDMQRLRTIVGLTSRASR
jgi:adenosylcobyric acid synthase